MIRAAPSVRQHGTTLIELVASIVIVSIATFGLMLAISAGVSRSADPMIEQQAAAIAEAYLEEVVQAGFCDPDMAPLTQACRQKCTTSACGVCGGAGVGPVESSRAVYDDICDYDGIVDAGARDRNDAPLNGLGAYRVEVEVVDSGFTFGSPAIAADSGEVVRVDVTVSHGGLEHDIALSAFRSNAQ